MSLQDSPAVASAPKRPRSRKRWLFIVTVIGMLIGIVVNLFEPRVFQSSTSILVIPQRVPEDFVRPTVTVDLSERLNLISQQILSRTRLERIIQEFSLYERERRTMVMENVVEQMRRDISVAIARPRNRDDDIDNFSVSFEAQHPLTAMRVTERLASLFVQENLEDRELLADQTNQFLKGQVDGLRRRLLEKELTLIALRRRGLPSGSETAEYEVLRDSFKKLLAHSEDARIAVDVERRQIGEQFRIIDGARLPEVPIRPTIFPFLALGALGGLTFGVVLLLFSARWRRRRARAAAAAA